MYDLVKVMYLGESDPIRFINGKVYEVIESVDRFYRIIDETGEPYLYTLKNFKILTKKE